jgi:hypothetical protein
MHVNVGRRALLLVAVAATTVAAGAGVAYATGVIASDQGTTIVGCAKKQNGQLRIVTNASQCLTSENTVSFAAPGPAPGPVAVAVDCGAGQTVQHAIDTADATQPLTVTISGTCTESVALFRDNVTLQAAASGGGIAAPPGGGDPALTVGGRNVGLQGLTLGGTDGAPSLVTASGATVHTQDLHVTGGGVNAGESSSLGLENVTIDSYQNAGLGANTGAIVYLDGGSITGCGVKAFTGGRVFLRNGVSVTGARFQGVDASDGGSIVIEGATISTSGNYGAFAEAGGNIVVEGADTVVSGGGFAGVEAANGGTATIGVGAHVSGNGAGHNGAGVAAISGGHLSIQEGAVVENNTGAGVRLAGGSTLSMGGEAVVQHNGGDGISLSDTSVATFLKSSITGNTGEGIRCDSDSTGAEIRAQTDGGPDAVTVTGNGNGSLPQQIDCRNAHQPG